MAKIVIVDSVVVGKGCSRCGEMLPISAFRRRSDGKGNGYQSRCKKCISEVDREKYHSSGRGLERLRRYRKNNADKCKIWGQRSHWKYRDQRLANMRKWHAGHRALMTREEILSENARVRAITEKAKHDAFVLFGGKCMRCGFNDFRALQLDHKNGGGRRARAPRGYALYNRILRGIIKIDGLQLLCSNCNWIKRWENNECHRIEG